MAKEVFAEDLERLIAALEGVVAARVFATSGGQITQVYVTVDPAADVRAVRRGVGTALVSSYGIPIEPWRIQIVQPRSGAASAGSLQFRVLRVEETVGAAEMIAVVQVAWSRGGAERIVSGRARGPLGPADRLRTLAAATIDGARDALDPRWRRVAAHDASVVTFFGRPTALVGVSVAAPRADARALGVAQEEASADAVVSAALDAVVKLSARAASAEARPQDRRAALEAMRRYVESSERQPWAAQPADAHGSPAPAGPPAAVPAGRGESRAPGGESAARLYPRADPSNGEDPDRSSGRQEAPEGGADMTVGGDLPHAAGAAGCAGRLSIEDVWYQSLIANRTPVHVRCRDGYELHPAVLRDIDVDSVLLERAGATELIYKRAILSIRPLADPAAEA